MPRQTQYDPDSPFATVKEAARRLGVSVFLIRQMIANGYCPVIRSGDNVRVNVGALYRILEIESLKSLKEPPPEFTA